MSFPNLGSLCLDLFYMRRKISFYFGLKNIILKISPTFETLFESNRFTTKLKGRYRDSPDTPASKHYMASLITNITHQNGLLLLFVCLFVFLPEGEPTMAHRVFFYIQPNLLLTDKVKTTCQNFLLTNVFDEDFRLVSACQYNHPFFEQVQNPSLYIFCKR